MAGLGIPLARRLWESVPRGFWEDVEALVPVPLGFRRRWERGYNPSQLLARELSRLTDIPCREALKKTRSTAAQMSLERSKRLRNPRGAYEFRKGPRAPGRAVLVDDVYTTGATLEECARVLKKAGASWVGAVVLGRTEHRA
jgi:ComF family protein